jgi:hypothetical protein
VIGIGDCAAPRPNRRHRRRQQTPDKHAPVSRCHALPQFASMRNPGHDLPPAQGRST